jgi:DNA polymerase-3 subunit epsilon
VTSIVAASPNHSPGDEAPPPGPPWDLPIAEAPLAFLDLEMTGLRLGDDRVVEICVERVRGDVVEARVDRLVDPGQRRGAEHVHGLGEIQLAGAPPFAAVAEEVCAAIEGAVVVAHAAAWDLAFLGEELRRAGLEARAPKHAIDTLVLCRRAFHLPSYALQKVAASIGFSAERAHRASDDVRTLRAVFSRVITELAPTTARDLWDVRVGERLPRTTLVAALDEALSSGGPIDVIYRPAHRGPERLTIVLTALVPPHAIGYLLPGRGRRELRIDRILRIEPASSSS